MGPETLNEIQSKPTQEEPAQQEIERGQTPDPEPPTAQQSRKRPTSFIRGRVVSTSTKRPPRVSSPKPP